MLHVDPTDPTPIPLQVERSLRSAIADGVLQAGDALPTPRQLSVSLRVNANVIAQVYRHLEQAGLLEVRPGVGTVVGQVDPALRQRDARDERLRELEDRFLADAAALGFSLDEVIIHLDSRRG